METETETQFEAETDEAPKLIGNPKKLGDGSWGAWVDGQPQVGDTVTIQTRAGKQWDAEITEIVERAGEHTVVRTKGLTVTEPPAKRIK